VAITIDNERDRVPETGQSPRINRYFLLITSLIRRMQEILICRDERVSNN
jgi:hypothetical protein